MSPPRVTPPEPSGRDGSVTLPEVEPNSTEPARLPPLPLASDAALASTARASSVSAPAAAAATDSGGAASLDPASATTSAPDAAPHQTLLSVAWLCVLAVGLGCLLTGVLTLWTVPRRSAVMSAADAPSPTSAGAARPSPMPRMRPRCPPTPRLLVGEIWIGQFLPEVARRSPGPQRKEQRDELINGDDDRGDLGDDVDVSDVDDSSVVMTGGLQDEQEAVNEAEHEI